MTILGMPAPALLDKGASLSLIGDSIHEHCEKRSVKLSGNKVKLQMACGSGICAHGVARLCIAINGNKHRHIFVYLPCLAVLVILGREFIVKKMHETLYLRKRL